jgi:hypothetical protein
MKTELNTAVKAASLLGLLGFAAPAFAYLDPSTGSMILSAIVGLFATLALTIKTYWYKLKAFFRRDAQPHPSPDKDQQPGSEPTPDN